MAKAKSDLLRKRLFEMQAGGGVAWSNLRKSNLEMYKHLAEIYFWWQDAKREKGYLEAEYAKLPIKFRNTNQLVNFIPLFWLIWGSSNCNKDIASRHSKAMNEIHKEYLRDKRNYKKDRVYKLAKFIERSNGVNGLCNYKKEEIDTEEAFYAEEELLKQEKHIKFLKANANKSILSQTQEAIVVYDEAKTFYSSQPTQRILDFGSELATNDDELSLVLVRKTAAGYELLGTTNEEALVKAVTITNFKHNLNAIPPAIKCILETLRTQTLPSSLNKSSKYLIEYTKGKNKKPMYKRLLYRSKTKDFLLSNVRSKVGVVTTVKPITNGFYEGESDIFLSPLSTKIIERKLLANYSFNLYKLESEEKYTFEVEKLFRLQNMFNWNDFLHIDFWSFKANYDLPLFQVDVDDNAFDRVSWEHNLEIGFFRQLATKVLDKWFVTHGKLIKRDKGEICQLTFEQSKLSIRFVYVDEDLEAGGEVVFKVPTVSISKMNLRFKTKDIMHVMRAIADFNTNNVMVRANSDILQFEYANDSATYTISVPTINNKNQRNTKAFTSYTATINENIEIEHDDFDYEQDALID